jgi:transcriptional regulator with XRE-family HTH domain
MKTKHTHTLLFIHIAENGDRKEKERICSEAKISMSTLAKILRGHMPRPEIRYRIFKLTGIKLDESDDFPDLQKLNAS